MKKQILKIGSALNKAQQQEVFGGSTLVGVEPVICAPGQTCEEDDDCCDGEVCGWIYNSDFEFNEKKWGNQEQNQGSYRICS